MLLLHCSPRLLLRLSPSHNLPAASFARPGRSLRRSTALRAEPEPPPSTPAAEPPDAGDADGGEGEGPVELRAPTLFSFDENPTPLQTATSVLLTGAISVFLFRSLRRRARRAKELRVRSSGVQKPNNLSEEALEGLRLVSASPIETDKPPSPVQALLGGIAAGVIALILYKFTTTIEAALNRQTISDNFSHFAYMAPLRYWPGWSTGSSLMHGSPDNDNNKNNYKWDVLPSNFCVWNQLGGINTVFPPAYFCFHHGRRLQQLLRRENQRAVQHKGLI